MKVAVLEDYQRATPGLACFARLAGHEVEVSSEPMRDENVLVAKLNQFEALVLIRERTRFASSLLDRLPALKLVVQTAKIGPQARLHRLRPHRAAPDALRAGFRDAGERVGPGKHARKGEGGGRNRG